MQALPYLYLLLAFLIGALPFSLWVGRLALGKDIRTVGDTNPGATNVLRAGGKGAAALALLLDVLKGLLPVGLAHFYGHWDGWLLVILALMPVLGHAYSPFLGGRGGKAVATSGGIWSGLTAWEGITIGSLFLVVGSYLFGGNGWAVLMAMSGMVIYLLATPPSWNLLDARPDSWIIAAVGLLNLFLLAWKHRADLRQSPRWRRRTKKHEGEWQA